LFFSVPSIQNTHNKKNKIKNSHGSAANRKRVRNEETKTIQRELSVVAIYLSFCIVAGYAL
jgi:hypothetical protein